MVGGGKPDGEADWAEPTFEAVESSADRIVNGMRTPEFDHLGAVISFVSDGTDVPESKLIFLLIIGPRFVTPKGVCRCGRILMFSNSGRRSGT